MRRVSRVHLPSACDLSALRCSSHAHVPPALGNTLDVDFTRVRAELPPYQPVPGAGFESYAVGYVEFPGYLRIEGRLTTDDPEQLRIGMGMEVVAMPRGGSLVYAFAPVPPQTEARDG